MKTDYTKVYSEGGDEPVVEAVSITRGDVTILIDSCDLDILNLMFCDDSNRHHDVSVTDTKENDDTHVY